jgi:hypothetical protein
MSVLARTLSELKGRGAGQALSGSGDAGAAVDPLVATMLDVGDGGAEVAAGWHALNSNDAATVATADRPRPVITVTLSQASPGGARLRTYTRLCTIPSAGFAVRRRGGAVRRC